MFYQDEVDLAQRAFGDSVDAPLAKDVTVLANEDFVSRGLERNHIRFCSNNSAVVKMLSV
jgi:hypothetical protein